MEHEKVCNDCGHEWMSMDDWEACPECESDNVSKVDIDEDLDIPQEAFEE